MTNVVPLRKDRKLIDAHVTELRGSGLNDETIELARLYSTSDRDELSKLILRKFKRTVPALVFPCFLPGGDEPVFYRVKPRTAGRGGKYTQASRDALGFGFGIYYPPRTLRDGKLRSDAPLVFTEGEKKTLALDQLGYAAIGSQGVDCFHDADHKEDTGGEYRLHPWIRDHVRIEGRRCIIAFDAQALDDNHPVHHAAARLAGMLKEAGAASVHLRPCPPLEEEKEPLKAGIDDLYHHRGADAVRAVIDGEDAPMVPVSPSRRGMPVHDVKGLRNAPCEKALCWPEGYTLRRNEVWTIGGEDKPKKVTDSVMLPVEIQVNAETGHERVRVMFRRQAVWKSATVDRVDLGDKGRLIRELRPHGAMVDSNNARELVGFLTAFEALNERAIPRVRTVPRCGWHDIETDEGTQTTFLAPASVNEAPIVFDGREGLRSVVAGLGARGEYDKHATALRRAFEEDDIAAAAILGALAAPLLRPLGADAFGLHLVGDSSRGKSSMLKIAASVYGNPKSKSWLPSWNSTSVGHEVRASVLCDLPFCVDEVGAAGGHAGDRDAEIYRLIDGTGRQRGTKDGGLRELRRWRTIVLSTGEKQLATEDTNAGAKARIFEMRVTGFGQWGAVEVDEMRDAAIANAGQVGQRWLRWLVSLPPEAWADWRKKFHSLTQQARARALETDPTGMAVRRSAFVALLGLVETMAFCAGLGFGTIQPSVAFRLFGWLVTEGRVQTAGERGLDLVRDWITARPDLFHRLRKSSSRDGEQPASRQDKERAGFIGDEHVLFVPTALSHFLSAHNLDGNAIIRSWHESGWLVTTSGRTRYKKRIPDMGAIWTVALKSPVLFPPEAGVA